LGAFKIVHKRLLRIRLLLLRLKLLLLTFAVFTSGGIFVDSSGSTFLPTALTRLSSTRDWHLIFESLVRTNGQLFCITAIKLTILSVIVIIKLEEIPLATC